MMTSFAQEHFTTILCECVSSQLDNIKDKLQKRLLKFASKNI